MIPNSKPRTMSMMMVMAALAGGTFPTLGAIYSGNTDKTRVPNPEVQNAATQKRLRKQEGNKKNELHKD